MKRMIQISTAMVTAMLLALAPAGHATSDTVQELPDTPDGTIKAVAASISNHQPAILWDAMPASYQNDMNTLVKEFAEAVDPEVYAKSFDVIGKLGDVLATKSDFIANNPLAAEGMADQDDAPAMLKKLGELINTVAQSDLNSVESLKSLDARAFLSSTGSAVLVHSMALAEMTGEEQDLEVIRQLNDVQVEVISLEGDSATLEVSVPDGEVEEIALTRVEGKWVPAEMASEWDDMVAEMREGIVTMTAAENKMQTMMVLNMADTALTSLQSANTQEEFDQAIMQLVGMMMGAGGGGGF